MVSQSEREPITTATLVCFTISSSFGFPTLATEKKAEKAT